MQAFLSGLKALLTDLIDNDTLIIVGVLILALYGDIELKKIITAGLLAYMGVKQNGGVK